ncbi:MAG: hypothetical protein LBD08_03945 [Treponema sp.]|jgi:hypothetical protein|nr:hypothetical protein [Treponema sp.]
MNRKVKRRLKKAAVFSVCAALVFFVSAPVNSALAVEKNAAKTAANAAYFSGGAGMEAVEAARASANSLDGAVNAGLTALLWLFIALAVYNGGCAVYKYTLSKEEKYESNEVCTGAPGGRPADRLYEAVQPPRRGSD